jgi:phosphoglycerate dehydrogenase-like enzyme
MREIRKIVLSSPLTPEQIAELKAIAPQAEWHTYIHYTAEEEHVRTADVILGNPPPEMVAKCENLKWIQLCSAGTDGYMDVVPEGAMFTNGTGAYGPAISEHMIAMLLAAKRNLLHYYEDNKAHIWQPINTATTVDGSVILVLGMGDLGGNFARRAKAMGAYIIGLRRSDTTCPDYCDEMHLIDELDSLLPRADVVAMSLPNNSNTYHIMDARRFALMKKGAILINVGRGKAIDQVAMRDALESGQLGFAGLDVADPEPLPPDDPLWEAKNILITPHVSGGWRVPSVVARVKDILARNLSAYVNEQPLINTVDRSTGYRATPTEHHE